MVDKEFFSLAVIMFTEVLGWSLILPFLPYYAQELGATPFMVGILISVFSICQFISAPIIGKLSDKYGRKPLFLISQASTTIGFLVLAFANSLPLIFLSRVIDGLFGSNPAIINSYVSDISKGKKRMKNYAYISAAFGFGFLVGPAVGGLLSTISYSIPSFIAAGISIFSMFLIVFTLRETVDKKNKIKLNFRDFLPAKDTVRFLQMRNFRGILMEYFLFALGFTVFTSTLALYVSYQLGFGPVDVGTALMVLGIFRVIFQLKVLPKLIDRFTERALRIAGIVVLSVTLFSFLFTSSRLSFYPFLILFGISAGIIRPMIKNEISERSDSKSYGKTMGVLDSLNSVAHMTGPLIGGYLINSFPAGILGIVSSLIVLSGLVFEFTGPPVLQTKP